MTFIILGALFIGLLYGAIYIFAAILKCWFCSNRSKGQMVAGLVGNVALIVFCAWTYSWSYDAALFIKIWVGLFLPVNLVLIACTPPKQNADKTNEKPKEDKSGTIEWR